MRDYNGEKLKDDEWLLKVKEDGTGFMTKLTKKGEIPVAFSDFSEGYPKYEEIPIKVIVETYSDGWWIKGFRSGKSQNWVKIIHPQGFIVEIYASDFFNNVIKNCIGAWVHKKCKWIGNKLEFNSATWKK